MPLFHIIFPKYTEAITAFRILMVGYFVTGTFRIPFGNILASLGNVKANLINAIITGSINIVLDVILISKFGSIGAAITSLSVAVISSILQGIFIMRHINKMKEN